MSSEPLLSLIGVSVKYGAFQALQGVSYSITAGSIVCLLGGNASGKSTSMKAIFGTVPLSSGSIYLEGQRIDQWPTAKRIGAGLGAVPEGRRVFVSLTVEENLKIGASTRRDRRAVQPDLDQIYDQFPVLRARRAQLAGSLSGGEQQMLAFGRALMSRPKIICMDEPSMGLAPIMVKQNFRLIQAMRNLGTSVFLVEQNANAALKIADYAYVLRAGHLVLEGSAAQVAADPGMREAYLGPATLPARHAVSRTEAPEVLKRG